MYFASGIVYFVRVQFGMDNMALLGLQALMMRFVEPGRPPWAVYVMSLDVALGLLALDPSVGPAVQPPPLNELNDIGEQNDEQNEPQQMPQLERARPNDVVEPDYPGENEPLHAHTD
jgi:hypothetical protein